MACEEQRAAWEAQQNNLVVKVEEERVAREAADMATVEADRAQADTAGAYNTYLQCLRAGAVILIGMAGFFGYAQLFAGELQPSQKASSLGGPSQKNSLLGEPTQKNSLLGEPTQKNRLMGAPQKHRLETEAQREPMGKRRGLGRVRMRDFPVERNFELSLLHHDRISPHRRLGRNKHRKWALLRLQLQGRRGY